MSETNTTMMTIEEAQEILKRHSYDGETVTNVFPMPAYPSDPTPAWVVLTSSQVVYLVDDVLVERYEHAGYRRRDLKPTTEEVFEQAKAAAAATVTHADGTVTVGA